MKSFVRLNEKKHIELVITAENDTEAIALRAWCEAHYKEHPEATLIVNFSVKREEV